MKLYRNLILVVFFSIAPYGCMAMKDQELTLPIYISLDMYGKIIAQNHSHQIIGTLKKFKEINSKILFDTRKSISEQTKNAIGQITQSLKQHIYRLRRDEANLELYLTTKCIFRRLASNVSDIASNPEIDAPHLTDYYIELGKLAIIHADIKSITKASAKIIGSKVKEENPQIPICSMSLQHAQTYAPQIVAVLKRVNEISTTALTDTDKPISLRTHYEIKKEMPVLTNLIAHTENDETHLGIYHTIPYIFLGIAHYIGHLQSRPDVHSSYLQDYYIELGKLAIIHTKIEELQKAFMAPENLDDRVSQVDSCILQ